MATRRSNGEGSLSWNEARQRWVGRASLGYNADGKRRIGTVSARTKTEARTKLRALLRDHDDGLPTQRAYTVGDAVEAWLMHGLVGRATRIRWRTGQAWLALMSSRDSASAGSRS